MLRGLRFLIAVLAIAAASAGSGSGAFVTASPDCIEMSMDDCPNHHSDRPIIPLCEQFLCGPGQIAFPELRQLPSPVVWKNEAPPPPRNDRDRGMLPSPPDLRPPIG